MKYLYMFILSLLSVAAHATNYYISPSGSDASDGESPATAWQTLAKVNATTFQYGDSLLFETGGTWSGQLSPLGSGTSVSPIIVSMYGTGNKPVINGPGTDNSAGFSLTDQSYWEIYNLEITNTQTTGGTARLCGVLIKSTQAAGINHVYIQNCYVHDVNALTNESNSNFSKGTGGIFFSGYTNQILIKGNHVANVAVEGIRNSSDPTQCSNFVIDSNLIENVYGDGIVLHGVANNSAITRNICRNTCYNTSSANYAGIWTYLSTGTVVAYNEVSGITGGGGNDGQPFDADISTNGDIFEYNYSHDNAKGFMLFMPSAQNIIVRYNLSVNDIGNVSNNKRLFNYTVTGNNNNKIYNNTFYINATTVSEIFQGGFIGNFSNNIVYCTTGTTVNQFSANAVNTSSTFYNNCFYPSSITSVNGPSGTVSGNIFADPGFVNAGLHRDGISDDVKNAYALSPSSPCRQTGVAIAGNGGIDFAGNNIANNVYASIGAIYPSDAPSWKTTSLFVLNDTYTYDGSAGSNYGSAANLVSKFGGGYASEGTATANGYSRRTYLKFSTDGIDTISNISKIYVRVRYYAKDNNYSVDGIKISLSRLSTWSETGLTWNSQTTDAGVLDSLGYTLDDGLAKPGSAPNPVTDDFINTSSHYMYLDVTDTIQKMISNHTLPGSLSFVLQGICTSVAGGTTPVGNTGYTYFSRDFRNANGQAVDSLSPTLLVYSTTLALTQSATTHYVDPNGNDASDGKSPATAWKTLSKVSSTTFSSGDSVLFLAGGTWNGQLSPQGSGTFGAPIIISRYGAGADPVINGNGTSAASATGAVQFTDQSYWELNHLEITNYNTGVASSRSGILAANSGSGQLRHIFISNCYVHNVNSGATAGDKTTGGIVFTGSFDSVVVNQCHVSNVAEEGIRTHGVTSSVNGFNTNVIFKDNVVENTRGDGIVLADVSSGGLADSNRVVNCSAGNAAAYAGLTVINSKSPIIQHNEVSSQLNGVAFDEDTTCSGAIFQYNYSHGNNGGFISIAPNVSGAAIRFNVSQDDGNGYQLFHTSNDSNTNNLIYNNTFYTGAGNATSLFSGADANGFVANFSNNIIDVNGGALSAFSTNVLNTGSQFKNNCFYPADSFTGAANYYGSQQTLIATDPEFVNAGSGSDGLASTTGYQLQPSSPCLASGTDIASNGDIDFPGTNISGRKFSTIGAIWPATEPQLTQTDIITEADAYTYDGSKASNYGTATNLVSKFGGGYAPEGTSTANGYSRRTYLKFASSGIKAISGIQKVYVRMRYYTKDNNYSVDGIKISLSRNAAWSEAGITWNSQATDGGALDSLGYTLDDGLVKPSSVPNPITDAFINSSSHYVYLDVTDTILSMIANNNLPADLSFVLQGICTSVTGPSGSTPIGNTGYTYFSREFTNTGGQTVDSLTPALMVYSSADNATLPVTTSLLSAQLAGHAVKLQWKTYTETNKNRFVVERSTDGINFSPLANVNAKGNSQQAVPYTCFDQSPNTGLNYYRWQQIDMNSKVASISNVVEVFVGNTTSNMVVYPNPVKTGTAFTIRFANNVSGDAIIHVADKRGHVVKTVTAHVEPGMQNIQISTADLASGIYFVSVVENDVVQNAKVVIE